MLILLSAALAGGPWSGQVGVSTSFVAGPVNPGVSGETLDGTYEVPATFNPSLTFALRLGVQRRWAKAGTLSLSWGLSRDQGLVDTADDGFRPGTGGTSSATVVDTSLPVLAWTHFDLLPKEAADLSVSARYALPLSRDALVCNPSAGGLGATVGIGGRLGKSVASLGFSAGADRALFVYGAAPRGRCGVGEAWTDTLAGPVLAEAGPGFSHLPNVAWTFEQTLTVAGWHAMFGGLPGVTKRASWSRAVTSASVGLRQRLDRADGPTRVESLAGDVEIGRAEVPAVLAVPWSVSGGYQFPVAAGGKVRTDLALTVTLSNQLPTLLFDPAARLRALPSTTSATLSLASIF
jgi:hypothetical protein